MGTCPAGTLHVKTGQALWGTGEPWAHDAPMCRGRSDTLHLGLSLSTQNAEMHGWRYLSRLPLRAV